MTFSELGMVNERHFLNQNICKYPNIFLLNKQNISVDAKKFYEKAAGDEIIQEIEEVDIFTEEEEDEEWSWD